MPDYSNMRSYGVPEHQTATTQVGNCEPPWHLQMGQLLFPLSPCLASSPLFPLHLYTFLSLFHYCQLCIFPPVFMLAVATLKVQVLLLHFCRVLNERTSYLEQSWTLIITETKNFLWRV